MNTLNTLCSEGVVGGGWWVEVVDGGGLGVFGVGWSIANISPSFAQLNIYFLFPFIAHLDRGVFSHNICPTTYPL